MKVTIIDPNEKLEVTIPDPNIFGSNPTGSTVLLSVNGVTADSAGNAQITPAIVGADVAGTAEGVRTDLEIKIAANKTLINTKADSAITTAALATKATLVELQAVQTLAETNEFKVNQKAQQTDLTALQTVVSQKVDKTELTDLVQQMGFLASEDFVLDKISSLLDGVGPELDTFKEIAAKLQLEDDQIAAIFDALANRVRFDAPQALTSTQKLQVRNTINAEAAGTAAGLVAAITPASIQAATEQQGLLADSALQVLDVSPAALSGKFWHLIDKEKIFEVGIPAFGTNGDDIPAVNDTLGQILSKLLNRIVTLGNIKADATSVTQALDTKEPLITAGTASQYIAGDKTLKTFPGLATTAVAGLMSAADKTTFDAMKSSNVVAGISSSSIPNDVIPAIGITPNTAIANADLVLSPKGTGALVMQAPDNGTLGGNKRGINAVDLQITRSVNTKVVTGEGSFGAGKDNSVTGAYSAALGLNNTTKSIYNFVVGNGNEIGSNSSASIALGVSNVVSAANSFAVGSTNTIQAGSTNSFALGSYNVITGASGIAIGSSNTLNGSVGLALGSNNTVGNASIALGSQNTSTNVGCAVLSGSTNTNNGLAANNYLNSPYGSVIIGGLFNSIATNSSGMIGAGSSCKINAGTYAAILGGTNNQVNANYSVILTGRYVTDNSIPGIWWNTGSHTSTNGQLQHGQISVYLLTTSATKAPLTTDGSPAATSNSIGLPNNSVLRYRGEAIVRTSTGDVAGWDIDVMVKRGTTNASVALVGSPTVTQKYVDNAISGFLLQVEVDTTTGYLQLNVTGATSVNARWAARLQATQLIY